jgi:hypothetical protein
MKQTKTISHLFKAFAILLLILFINGCRKDHQPVEQKNENRITVSETESSQNNGLVSKGGYSFSNLYPYVATASEIQAAKNAWLNSLSQRKGVAGRGSCIDLISNLPLLIAADEATGSGCSANTYWNITVRIYVREEVGTNYPSFDHVPAFTDVTNTPVAATLVNSGVELDANCDALLWDGRCQITQYFDYSIANLYAPGFNVFGGPAQFTMQIIPPTANCSTISFSGSVPGMLSAYYYANSPASLAVLYTTFNNNLFVADHCSATLCFPPPYVICPDSGVFKYRITGTTTWTVVNFTSLVNITTLVPGNTYEWECTLNYTIGGLPVTSLPQTGTFNT